MDSGEGGGDGGGGEERDADLNPQPLSPPLRTPEVLPEQGSSTHTSAVAPAKEPLSWPHPGQEGVEGPPAGEQTRGGEGNTGGGGHFQGTGGCQEPGVREEGRRAGCLLGLGTESEEGYTSAGEEEVFFTGGLQAALRSGVEEITEEAISNQSQTKSKCSLLPQLSQHSSSSSTAMASGTLDSSAAAHPKPRLPPGPPSPEPRPRTDSPSPKHLPRLPSSSAAAPPGDTEAGDTKGDGGRISGFPLSFNAQESAPPSPPATAEDDGPAEAVANEGGDEAPEPNDGRPEKEAAEDDGDAEGERAAPKNLDHDLSPNSSLTSHMTTMHSRNSCKTLKCPKCNWHYKSQHTLQVHMREKHPETGAQCVCGGPAGKCVCGGAARGVCGYCSSGKPHPRLARGETYACGYKPYRCEVCDYATSSKGNLSIHMQSDKHLNNVQNGGHCNGHHHDGGGGGVPQSHPVAEEQVYKLPLHAPAGPAAAPPQAHPPGKRWRCDVCDYETGIARNLRIHTTSEKHTHNMLRLQRGLYLSQCRSLAPHLKHLQNTGGELHINLRPAGQAVPEPPVTLGSTLTPSPSPSPSPPPLARPLSPAGALSPGVFQCLVCSGFSSDSVEAVERHLGAPRSLPQAEWCSLVAGGCHCRLCAYTTPLRANFSLHCQTDRHRARYQLAAHLREGGDRGQEGAAALVAKGNPVQLRCNLCDYVTASLEKLRGHALSSHHEASVRVYRFLQQYDGDVDGGSWLFHCLLCNHSSSSKVQLLKHSQTATHQQREGLLQLQPMGGEELAAIFTIRKSPDGELSEDIETSSDTNGGPPVQTKDICSLGVDQDSRTKEDAGGMEREKRSSMLPAKRPSSGCEEAESPRSPKRSRTHQQNENQQTVQCPLCQVALPFQTLRYHLTYLHSVAQDCVDKLIGAVTLSQTGPQLEAKPQMDFHSNTDSQKNNSGMNLNGSDTSDSPTTVETIKNTEESGDNTEVDVAPPKDVTALLTPPLEEALSYPSNSRQSPSQQSPSSPPTSPPSDPPPPSDRHGYRFRCSRCSLAFPTHEKLQLHWQYHAMRAATECPLCARRCRSQEALQRHMQNTHAQPDSTNTLNTHLAQHNAQTQVEQSTRSVEQHVRLSPQVGEEAGEEEDDDMEEETLVMEEKDGEDRSIEGKEAQSGVSGAQENILEMEKQQQQQEESGSEPIPNFYIKKGSNPTMDRYLDPSRPYKCTICSESFTQKTILLVHFNSVSHLHRARRALQESGPGHANPEPPRGPDPRPYRCRLCGVGYSQSSTLDIHLRSVLHQTRARAAQNAAQQITAATSAAPAPGPSTAATSAAPAPGPSTAATSAAPAPGPSTPTTSAAPAPGPSTAATSAAPAPGPSTAAQTALISEGASQSLPSAKRPDHVAPSVSSPAPAQLALHSQADSKQAQRTAAELLASRNQLLLMQQQQLAQAQAQLQQHTTLLQSQLFNPALLQHLPLGPESLLKQHFPIAPDNLLSLQQQLLLPFYLSGEMQLNPELILKSLELNQADSGIAALIDHLNSKGRRESPLPVDEKPPKRPSQTSAESPTKESEEGEGKAKACSRGSVVTQKESECDTPSLEEEKKEAATPAIKTEKQKEEANQVDCSQLNRLGFDCPPPRVPYAAVNGEPLRTLLQSYGYELALQYIQSRHQLKIANQMKLEGQKWACIEEKQMYLEKTMSNFIELRAETVKGYMEHKADEAGNLDKHGFSLEKAKKEEQGTLPKEEKCLDCGKLFSDALVLKTHQEYIHRQLFPTAVLERFSREYRLQYDQLYPLTQPPSEETSALAPKGSSEPEQLSEPIQPRPVFVSEAKPTTLVPVKDVPPTAPADSPPPSPQPQAHSNPIPSPSPPSTSKPSSQAKAVPLSLPKLPLAMPQFPLPPLPLPKMQLPPIPFPMELPLLPSVVMQSMALQSQPWLDSGMTPDMAKLYQPQLSPALLAQSAQINPVLLGQPSQPSPVLQPPPGTSATPDQQQSKRARTRISEEQLGILRQHFDINSLPSDEEVNKMSSQCVLPHKVIKHWFRNTLFKERQRDKDSPYNFNNPPTTVLDEPQEEAAQIQFPTEAASSMSPGLPANHSPQPQKADAHRGESNRGRRSSRTRFTEQQLETLQSVFEATPYPREEEYDRLSALLSLQNRVIVVWFQNARQRARKNQEKGAEDGVEGKQRFDETQRQSRIGNKNDVDTEDEGQGDRQNENSMDLTYEYYTLADSPADAHSPTHHTESKHEPVNGKPNSVKKKQEETAAAEDDNIQAQVEIRNGITEMDKPSQNKETGDAKKATPSPKPQPEISSEKPQHNSGSSSERTIASVPTLSPFTRDGTPSCSPAIDRPALNPLNLSSECVTDKACTPDATVKESLTATLSRSGETQPQNPLQHQTQTQFHCSFCPMSLPSPQLWQEHQTMHLLAAQTQVQLIHPGFTDRTMPYMMLHPNQTLMASQLLASAISQMHPNPAHPMIPQMNGMNLNNALSDHLSNALSGLPHASLSSGKQSSKAVSDVGCDVTGGGRELEDEQRRDKRQRTTITPEQLEVLYQRYSMDSNPTRGVLESIARDVGLKRRVVQVWFQNTRARERKGQFRSAGPGTSFSLGLNPLRCLFCRALFKVKSALDAHIRSRHWAEAERAGYNLPMSNGSAGQMGGASMLSLLDKAGTSASTGPTAHQGFVISDGDRRVEPLVASLCSAGELNGLEEEGGEYEEEEEEYPCDEGSSAAERGSLSPEGTGGPSAEWGETLSQRQYRQQQQQRQRTQMSHLQVLQLRDFYRSHRTPNRQECEALGQELGLPHRVVQVWFQNARAKEKRARGLSSDPADREQPELSAGAGERDRA